MYILIVGPLLEEKYGSADLLFVILATAFVTGVANYIFFPQYVVLGASGVVFALIILSSLTSFKDGTIPLTFILVSVLYIGSEVYSAIFVNDNISNFSHIVGGMVGGGLGFAGNKRNTN
jgi:GlpG protein